MTLRFLTLCVVLLSTACHGTIRLDAFGRPEKTEAQKQADFAASSPACGRLVEIDNIGGKYGQAARASKEYDEVLHQCTMDTITSANKTLVRYQQTLANLPRN